MLSKQEFVEEFFRETHMPVAPSMEQALGYFGVSRWVAFHQSRKLHGLCWADAKSNVCRSSSTVWNRFLAHPFVAPYLQLRRTGMSGIETLNFEAKDDDPDLLPTLPNGEIDCSVLDDPVRFREETRKMGYAIVLDRSTRRVFITTWTHAFFFLVFYRDGQSDTVRELLREDPLHERVFEILGKMFSEDRDEDDEEIDDYDVLQTSDWDDEPLPEDPAAEMKFLAWLDQRWNNAANLHQLALQHCRYRQYSEALDALERALKIRPEHPIINWTTSQVYGSLRRWPEALETCKKTIQLQTTSEKEVPAEALFMWEGRCFSELSRYAEAIEAYKLVTDLKPNHVDAYYELGWCHTELDEYAEAAAAHEQEIKLRISNASGADEKGISKLSRAYEELGMSYFFDLRLPEAEQALRHAIALIPRSLQAHQGLVAVYKEMGNDSEAEKEQGVVSQLEAAITPRLPSAH